MSQHRQITSPEPSRGRIVLWAVLAGLTSGVVLRVAGDGRWTWVHLVAVVFGLVVTALNLAMVMHTISQRADARMALIRQEARIHRTDQEAREARRINTGTWNGDAVGQVLTVRYDPAAGEFYVQGWLGDFFQVPTERPWSDRATMVQTIAELELTGELEPQDDEGTRAVRARLDLPGWDAERHDPEDDSYPQDTGERAQEAAWLADVTQTDLGAVQPLGTVQEETRRLPVPSGAYGPSAAALTPIAVPVFRTEAERAAWAADRDIPTEILPVQRDQCDISDLDPGWCITHKRYEG